MTPKYIIVGAQKCGTTSLFYNLGKHPHIENPYIKEIRFFSTKFGRGFDWYKAHFPRRSIATRDVITGEATPYYLFHPKSAARIASKLPKVKIVILLRNPVDRALSHYWHEVRLGREELPMEEAIFGRAEVLKQKRTRMNDSYYETRSAIHHSYLQRGIYYRQVVRYFKEFDESQIRIIKSENFFTHPRRVYRQTLSFLGLNSYPYPGVVANKHGNKQDAAPSVRARLREYYREYNYALYDLLGLKESWW